MNKNINAIFDSMADNNMEALGELYDMLSVRIFNYARAITKSKETAEDITHDVFLQIHKQAARIAIMENPVAYIMTIVRNQSFDHSRRNKRITASLEDVIETSGDSLPYNQLYIDEAFSRLPANQRETVYLHYICGFTQMEVARIMGTPLVTVKWRCAKALSQLQTYFINDKEDDYNNEVTRNYN